MKILVVDDETDMEPMIRQKFRRHIREKTYDFEFAFNGIEALEKIIEFPEISIVLSDINMPEMDGLTLACQNKGIEQSGVENSDCICLWRHGQYKDGHEQWRF